MIDNAENAGMRVLTEYNYEYLRFDARYYAGESPRQQAHLQMLAQYCKTQNIRSTSINVLNMKEAQSLIRLGVEIIQGYAVSEPKRNLNQAVRNIKRFHQLTKNSNQTWNGNPTRYAVSELKLI